MTYFVPISKACVYAALTAPADTTIVTAETYEYVRGTFSNSPMIDFVFSATPTPAIQYKGSQTIYVEIDAHAVFKASVNGTLARCGIKKNGNLITESVMTMFCKTAGEEFSLSGTCVTQLAYNDTIQIVVTTDGDSDVVTFTNLCTTIKAFIR